MVFFSEQDGKEGIYNCWPNCNFIISASLLILMPTLVQKRVVDDVHKRLDSFVEHWKNGKLSKPVKASMTSLVDGMCDK